MNKKDIDEMFKIINKGSTKEISERIKNIQTKNKLMSKENLNEFDFYKVEPIIIEIYRELCQKVENI